MVRKCANRVGKYRSRFEEKGKEARRGTRMPIWPEREGRGGAKVNQRRAFHQDFADEKRTETTTRKKSAEQALKFILQSGKRGGERKASSLF